MEHAGGKQCFVRPNVRVEAGPAVLHLARAGHHVPQAPRGHGAMPLGLASNEGLGRAVLSELPRWAWQRLCYSCWRAPVASRSALQMVVCRVSKPPPTTGDVCAGGRGGPTT